MAGRTNKTHSRSRHGDAYRQIYRRIAELSKCYVAPSTEKENLDRPPDPDTRAVMYGRRCQFSLIVDGQNVSHTGILERRQQIGSCVVRMGGIAGVSTDHHHRFKGYSRRVMENSLRWMRQNGMDVTVLFGITGFYPKFGYAKAFPAITFELAVRDAETLDSSGFRFVNFTDRYLPAVLKMYHATHAGVTGPIRRDIRNWTPFSKGSVWTAQALCKVALDGAGRPVGYFVHDDVHLQANVLEAGFATTAVLPAILHAAAKLAWRRRIEKITLLLGEDHPLIERCIPLGIKKEMRYQRDGGAMVRMINIPSAMRKVAPDLARRLSGSGRLNIRTNLDSVSLNWSKGEVTVGPVGAGASVVMGQWALGQLLFGYRSANALAADGALKASRNSIAVLGRMFPTKPHWFPTVDRF